MKNNTGKKALGYPCWGESHSPEALKQMDDAVRLPVSVKGALMADAHMGYGLPIGGVLAVDNAVIPYAVGVDIACRMRLSVLDTPVDEYKKNPGKYRIALETGTRFGVGKTFSTPKEHPVMDEDWSFCKRVRSLKSKAWKQLGTSGSGNHFAEFGVLTLQKTALGLKKGTYIALLTHSGSRGAGAAVADHYSTIAKKCHPELPKGLNNLSWLDMESGEGMEYWHAMQLMGKYAAANHEVIHEATLNSLKETALCFVENHHNFAWKEHVGDRVLVVHRKGATPAGKGAFGVIPGSMASPAFVVRGKGNDLSINSAAHGAGRRMSRKAAKKRFSFTQITDVLKQNGIELISAGVDEAPMAYKDIDTVMAQQRDLVDVIARFDPKLVKMAPAGKKSKI